MSDVGRRVTQHENDIREILTELAEFRGQVSDDLDELQANVGQIRDMAEEFTQVRIDIGTLQAGVDRLLFLLDPPISES